MSIELKIKSKSLAVEAQIIRNEELKLKKQIAWLKERQKPYLHLQNQLLSISQHRRWDVRNEQRATYLARAFMSGKSYSEVEQGVDIFFRNCYIESRVLKIVNKYSDRKDQIDRKVLDTWFMT